MAFPQPNHLSKSELEDILSSFPHESVLTVTKIRYRNKEPIRRSESMSVDQVRELVFDKLENGLGTDIELYVPSIGKTLVGHHDGVFWLE